MARTLEEISQIAGVSQEFAHSDLIKLFAWYLHTERNQDFFTAAEVGKCYVQLHLLPPQAFGPYVASLEKKRDILRSAKGLKLSKSARDGLSNRYSFHPITVATRTELLKLSSLVPSVDEREFLGDVLLCYGCGANRAAIVMTWILAYDHLRRFVLAHHLPEFNTGWPKRFAKDHAKSRISAIAKIEDFSELQEADVLEICRSGAIITADVYKVLKQGLDMRNSAAHPSNIKFEQVVVEAYLSSMVHNVVLLLHI